MEAVNAHGAMILQRLPGGGMLSRVAPLLPARAMKTFEVRMPLSTHFRKATCIEADCAHYRNGWVTGFSDVDLPHKWEAAQTYGGIAYRRGLRFKVNRTGNTVTFTFPPGQQCIEGHRVAVDRPPLYIARGGDWRGNPIRMSRLHANAADFRDDWLSTEDRFRELQKRG